MNLIRQFLQCDVAQDVMESTLLMAFLVVLAAALYLQNSAAIAAILGITNDHLNAAVSAARP